ncbi:hypothetical protein [Candidatus Berkiella aquae]|uniref:Uncharacterized protein n=1 Tax=Candidatus Berkiella aquae TaxID=295108 RepID=A0A0Q9YKM7_9GAMM|nr:hypothetical protein [Candidatus Berkiella aquae]MCS5711102.1 hypothetical protein [Candidatus Berkiella aquae]
MKYTGPQQFVKSDEALNNVSGEDFDHQIEMGNASGEHILPSYQRELDQARHNEAISNAPICKPSQRRSKIEPIESAAVIETKRIKTQEENNDSKKVSKSKKY